MMELKERKDLGYFEIKRMKNAMKSKTVTIPKGLSKEEMRKFILNN